MSYFPMTCLIDPKTNESKTVYVTCVDDGSEPQHVVFRDRQGRTYARNPNRQHGVIEVAESDNAADPPPEPAHQISPEPQAFPSDPFPVVVRGGQFAETVHVRAHVRPDGLAIFVAADGSGRTFERGASGGPSVVEIGA